MDHTIYTIPTIWEDQQQPAALASRAKDRALLYLLHSVFVQRQGTLNGAGRRTTGRRLQICCTGAACVSLSAAGAFGAYGTQNIVNTRLGLTQSGRSVHRNHSIHRRSAVLGAVNPSCPPRCEGETGGINCAGLPDRCGGHNNFVRKCAEHLRIS